MKKQKLELTWIGKDVRPRLEPRILLAHPECSYHAGRRPASADFCGIPLAHPENHAIDMLSVFSEPFCRRRQNGQSGLVSR